MNYIPSLDEIIESIEEMIENLEMQPNGEDFYVAVEIAHQLKDELLQYNPDGDESEDE